MASLGAAAAGRHRWRRLAAAAAATVRLLLLVMVMVATPPHIQAAGRSSYSIGDLRIGGGRPGIDALAQWASMPPACAAAAVADFPARLELRQWDARTAVRDGSAGPYLRDYPAVHSVQVPAGCSPTAWAWHRLLEAAKLTIAWDLQYCHHHAPDYEAAPMHRIACGPDAQGYGTCTCAAAGLNRTHPWRGLDCSNFVAWLLNFCFGFYPTSGLPAQACHPTRAPGRLLSNITTSRLDQLLPGDLVFLTPGGLGSTSRSSSSSSGRSSTSSSSSSKGSAGASKAAAPPVRVSHVVVWTGWAVNFNTSLTTPFDNATLLARLSAPRQREAVSCMRAQLAAGRRVYVIADSTHDGPALRPFCRLSGFSHARRVINPDVAAFARVNDDAVAAWDATARECMSRLALLQEEG